jgi:hypothetical protein
VRKHPIQELNTTIRQFKRYSSELLVQNLIHQGKINRRNENSAIIVIKQRQGQIRAEADCS